MLWIALEGAVNVRDVGGMPTTDGSVTAEKRLLRADNLQALSDPDVSRLVQEFGLTHESMGEVVGKSRAQIGNMLRLLRLPERTKAAVRTGTLTFGHARALLGHAAPDALLDQVVARALSVRQTEALVSRQNVVREPVVPQPASSDTRSLEKRLSDLLGQRVQVNVAGNGSGSLTIRFGDMYQVEALVDRLSGQ